MDIDQLERLVGSPENLAVGQRIADEAITLVRDNGQVLPLRRRTAGIWRERRELRKGAASVSISDRGAQPSCCGNFFRRYAHRVGTRAGARDSGARAGCADYLCRCALGCRNAAVIAPAVEAAEHVIVARVCDSHGGQGDSVGGGIEKYCGHGRSKRWFAECDTEIERRHARLFWRWAIRM